MADSSFTSSSKLLLLKKLAILFIVIALGDFLIGVTLKKIYFSQTAGTDYKTNYAITRAEGDILIFGSSRAYRHYSPAIIEQELGLSTFNLGRFGQSIFYNKALQQVIFDRHIPKMVILDIDPNELLYNESHYVRTSCLLPYYRDYQAIRNVINDVRGNSERIKNLSSIYPYNSTLIFSIRNRLVNDDPNYLDSKGYKPYKQVLSMEKYEALLSSTMKFDILNESTLDQKKIEYLEAFLKNALYNDIKVVVSISPMLYKISNDASYRKTKEICHSMNVPVFDFYADLEFNSINKYYDLNHLNIRGATEFSKKLSLLLKEETIM